MRTWTFYENYPSVGPAMYDGLIIIDVLKTNDATRALCPMAEAWYAEWLKKPF